MSSQIRNHQLLARIKSLIALDLVLYLQRSPLSEDGGVTWRWAALGRPGWYELNRLPLYAETLDSIVQWSFNTRFQNRSPRCVRIAGFQVRGDRRDQVFPHRRWRAFPDRDVEFCINFSPLRVGLRLFHKSQDRIS